MAPTSQSGNRVLELLLGGETEYIRSGGGAQSCQIDVRRRFQHRHDEILIGFYNHRLGHFLAGHMSALRNLLGRIRTPMFESLRISRLGCREIVLN